MQKEIKAMNDIEFQAKLKNGTYDCLVGKEPADGTTIYSSNAHNYEILLKGLNEDQLHEIINRIGPTGNGSIAVKAGMITIFRKYI